MAVTSLPIIDYGVDYSGARPSDDTIKSKNNKFVVRYLTAPGDRRGITREEFQKHIANGVAVVLVDEEGNGDRALQGYQAGHVDGENSRMRAIALGWPFNRPIYGATDRDISGSQLPIAVEYYKGFRDGLGEYEAGAYGGKLLLQTLANYGIVKWLWSSNATYWDHGVDVPHLNIQQYWSNNPAIPDTDLNTSHTLDYGQYPAPHGDDDMLPYSQWADEDKRQLSADVRGMIEGVYTDWKEDDSPFTLKKLSEKVDGHALDVTAVLQGVAVLNGKKFVGFNQGAPIFEDL